MWLPQGTNGDMELFTEQMVSAWLISFHLYHQQSVLQFDIVVNINSKLLGSPSSFS